MGLAVSFGRVGLLGFGGGPSMIPLIQAEVIKTRGWMSQEQFMDAYGFGNALPGPIATKLAGYVGYRVAGWLGALVALLSLTVPTILAVVLLAAAYVRFREHPVVVGVMSGVRPVVVGLLIVVLVEFARSALVRDSRLWRWALAAVGLVIAIVTGAHPGLLILAGGCFGLIMGRWRA
jgi:chromate transporter